jgi:Patatin-like phospholipase
MAGGAFSFAEMLRDEYAYFFEAPPRATIKVYEKHLRDLPQLIRRLQRPPGEWTARESVLARYCRFRGAETPAQERKAVRNAFQALIDFRTVEELPGKPSLYEAMLDKSHPESAARLRHPEVLRKLLRIPGARACVFRDGDTALIIARSEMLRDLFRERSPAIRLIHNMAAGRDLLIAYPALLSTIADDQALEAFFSGPEENRQKLIKEFESEKSWRALWPTVRPRTEKDDLAGDAVKLREKFGLVERSACDADFQLFNAIVLEAAFPDHFTDSYDVRALNSALHEKGMAAICLSGGGIRSATFNLGVLQGLADHGLLTRFHYLSTVSGGGYIGSWIRRHPDGLTGVAHDIKSPPADPEEPEVRPIHHLREYSSYLAPRPASLSLDTWTLIATYFRNLLLNWTILLPVIAAILALPRLFESAVYRAAKSGLSVSAFIVCLASGWAGLVLVVWMRPKKERRSGPEPTAAELRTARHLSGIWIYPLLVSAVSFCIFWASLDPAFDGEVIHGGVIPYLLSITSAMVAAGFVVCQAYLLAAGKNVWWRLWAALKLLVTPKSYFKILRRSAGELLAAAAAGWLSGSLLRVSFAAAFPPHQLLTSRETLYLERFVCLGVPLFLCAFFVEAALLVGFTTLRTDDHDREWWARTAAVTMLTGFMVLLLCVAGLLLPLLVAQLPVILASAGGVGAVTSWLVARSATLRSREERGTSSRMLLTFILHTSTLVAIAVILGAIGLAATAVLTLVTNYQVPFPPAVFRSELTTAGGIHLRVLQQAGLADLGAFVTIAVVGAWFISLMLDVNIYSMHAMYRNRLIRAFLGASRWGRLPDPFTGFDPHDDVAMYKLRPEALWTSSYLNFGALVSALARNTVIFPQLHPRVQTLVQAYVTNGSKGPAEAEVCSELTRALNELMASRDIAHNLEAPPNYDLFCQNRKYLQTVFGDWLRPATAHDDPASCSTSAIPPIRGNEEEEERLILRTLGCHKNDATVPVRQRPPLHIINTALNLVGGDKLAWQERKAESFTISPLHAGNRWLGYRDAFSYAHRISLGTSLAISGAAISPNMGNKSTAAVTFLMTLFNARLGWWLGNPSRPKFAKPGPTAATLQSLLAEAMGGTHDKSNYVFLSDGGHFDNLGLYEMVRRRCRWIVVSDATADGKFAFGDLGNAVRKIRVDMGIPITLKTAYLPPAPDEKVGRYCAIGVIHYKDVDDVDKEHGYGCLLYIKPAVRADCPPDVRNYQKQSDAFPHESTVDQFFCESQFESYRALGRHMIGRICGDKLGRPARQVKTFRQIMTWAFDYIRQAESGPVSVKLVDM